MRTPLAEQCWHRLRKQHKQLYPPFRWLILHVLGEPSFGLGGNHSLINMGEPFRRSFSWSLSRSLRWRFHRSDWKRARVRKGHTQNTVAPPVVLDTWKLHQGGVQQQPQHMEEFLHIDIGPRVSPPSNTVRTGSWQRFEAWLHTSSKGNLSKNDGPGDPNFSIRESTDGPTYANPSMSYCQSSSA